MPPSLPVTPPLVLLLAAPLVMTGARPGPADFLGVVVAAAIVALAGERATTLLAPRTGAASRVGWHLVFGLVLASLCVAAVCHVGRTSAAVGFAVFTLATIAVALATRRRVPEANPAQWRDALRVTAIVVATLTWARRQLAPFPDPGVDGTLAVWSDFVLHAVEIAQYSNPEGIGAGAMLLAGEPPIFYHRAPYALPAAIAQLLDLPPLHTAIATLLPVGLVVAIVGTALFADRLAGGRTSAGWLAAACALLLPDAAEYGLRNGFFGMHWLLFTAPGTGWAVGACLLSACLALDGLSSGDRRALVLACGLAASALFFRAHVFLLWVPALALLVAAGSVRDRPRVRGAAAACVGTALLCVLAVPSLRAEWLAFSAVDEYLPAVHGQMAPTGYDGVYAAAAATLPQPLLMVGAALAVLPATLGLLLPGLASLGVVRRATAGPVRLDAVPWALATAALLLTLFAPMARHGDVSEYQQRGLPLLYLAFVAAIAAGLVRLAPRSGPPARARLALSLVAMALATSALLRVNVDPAMPAPQGLRPYYPLALDAGSAGAAAYIRAHGGRGERIAAVPGEPDAMLNDSAAMLVALTGAPAWVGRAGVQLATAPEARRALIRGRLADLERIAERGGEALARERGIGWVVARPPGACAWASGDAAFRNDSVAVYRAGGDLR